MPATKIKSKWSSGNLLFVDAAGTTLLSIASTGAISIPGTLTTGATATSGAFPVGGRFSVDSGILAHADFPAPFFIAPAPCKLISAYEAHATKSTTGQTIQLEKLTSGTAPGSGTAMLNASVALDSTNDTPQTVAAGTVSNLTTGDRVGIRTSTGGATYANGKVVATFEWV